MHNLVENEASHIPMNERQVYAKHPRTLKTIVLSNLEALIGNVAGTLVRNSLDCRNCRVTLALTILRRSIKQIR